VQEIERAKIREIKTKIAAMLEERHALENKSPEKTRNKKAASVAEPSQYWSDFCSFFDYMLGLSEDSYAKLRLHTYHLTGDNYQNYYYGDKEKFLATSNLKLLTEGLPAKYILNEPEGGIGFKYEDGRFISRDILRFQQTISTFYRYKVMPEQAGKGHPKRVVVEVGGGYGGLIHHLSKIYQDTVYVLIDLPETSLFAAAYLSLLNPERKVYVYDKKDFQKILKPDRLKDFDFVILPNYILDSLSELRFDLAINQSSFQEMTTKQVVKYLDFIQKTLTGSLYSLNRDHQPRNKELPNLTDLLKERFDMVEVMDWKWNRDVDKKERRKSIKLWFKYILRIAATFLGFLPKPGKAQLPYHEYLCTQKK